MPRIAVISMLALAHVAAVILYWWVYRHFLNQLPKNSIKRLTAWLAFMLAILLIPLLQLSIGAESERVITVTIVIGECILAVIVQFYALLKMRRGARRTLS
jgi:hypothetical protein